MGLRDVVRSMRPQIMRLCDSDVASNKDAQRTNLGSQTECLPVVRAAKTGFNKSWNKGWGKSGNP